jgi:sigma-54 dependent transcriptional regulator, flagellar regulatory protein
MLDWHTPTDPKQALLALESATVAFANADADSERTLGIALDHLIDVTGADAGAIAVPDPQDGKPEFLAERFLDEAGPVSRTVLESALADRDAKTIVTEPPASASVFASNITSILCTPVRRSGKTLAAVYLDRRDKPPFDEVARSLAVSFASVLALSLDLLRRVEATEKEAEEARAVAAHTHGYWHLGAVRTNNRSFAECLQLAERVARSDVTLLILGETGSGKEHLARCVHAASERRDAPFLPVNCAAIPETLLEAELFGHERGAFTGAIGTRRGKFELADGGTLFLDEIGDLPLAMQPKLLRVLEDKKVARLGGTGEKTLDVRIIAATHHNLAVAVREGRFREDLFYRLSVVELKLPPLRERLEDIPQMAEAFLGLETERTGRRLRWDPAGLRRLSKHPWPGNVRELRNAVEKLSVLVEGPSITAGDVESFALQAAAGMTQPRPATSGEPPSRRLDEAERQIRELQAAMEELRALVGAASPAELPEASEPAPVAMGGRSYHEQMEEASRQVVLRALEEAGSITGAARLLGLSRQNLSIKCKQLGLARS